MVCWPLLCLLVLVDASLTEFEDGFMRSELETRLLHLEPGEIIMADEDVSKQTERMVNYLLSQECVYFALLLHCEA